MSAPGPPVWAIAAIVAGCTAFLGVLAALAYCCMRDSEEAQLQQSAASCAEQQPEEQPEEQPAEGEQEAASPQLKPGAQAALEAAASQQEEATLLSWKRQRGAAVAPAPAVKVGPSSNWLV